MIQVVMEMIIAFGIKWFSKFRLINKYMKNMVDDILHGIYVSNTTFYPMQFNDKLEKYIHWEHALEVTYLTMDLSSCFCEDAVIYLFRLMVYRVFSTRSIINNESCMYVHDFMHSIQHYKLSNIYNKVYNSLERLLEKSFAQFLPYTGTKNMVKFYKVVLSKLSKYIDMYNQIYRKDLNKYRKPVYRLLKEKLDAFHSVGSLDPIQN
jgi:hypothetical protein